MITTSTHSLSAESIMKLHGVSKIFRTTDHTDRVVLEDPSLNLCWGGIIAMLDKSGSDKSMLLRAMAGLVRAGHGRMLFRGREYSGPVQGIAMVFQSSALPPRLTVQQNVELGLEAQSVPKAECGEQVEQTTDLVGLSDFSGALPHKLSGGMRQRAGIARALVIEPDLLLVDEVFSALNVLTGENLHNEMLDPWEDRRTSTKSILIVLHNIEEAMMMADRIVILLSDPRHTHAEMRAPFPRPHSQDSATVRNFIDEVYGLITSPERVGVYVGMGPAAEQLAYRLPGTEIGQMEAILDLLVEAPSSSRADLPHLAEETDVTDDDLLPACGVLALLQLATIERGDIIVTPFGRTYMETELPKRRVLLGQRLLECVALAAHIRAELEANEGSEIRGECVLRELKAYLKSEEAGRVFKIGIEWGCYGEVCRCTYSIGMLTPPREEREEREEHKAQDDGDNTQ